MKHRSIKKENDEIEEEVQNNYPTCTVENVTKMFSLVLEESNETELSMIHSSKDSQLLSDYYKKHELKTKSP